MVLVICALKAGALVNTSCHRSFVRSLTVPSIVAKLASIVKQFALFHQPADGIQRPVLELYHA